MFKHQMVHKTMKQKDKNKKPLLQRSLIKVALVSAVLALVTAGVVPTVRADRYDDEIRSLQQQTSQSRDSLADLQMRASSFQNAIDILNAQIAQVTAQIVANQAEQSKLQAQIDEAQAELDQQRAVLSADIKAMYVDGDISTIEMLATSRNLSDFVDKEEYRNAVQTKIQEALRRINTLQTQLKNQQAVVVGLIQEQQAQQAQLDGDRAQQASLLAMNQGEQQQYNQQIKANQSKIAELRRSQAIENAKLFGSGLVNVPDSTGYPWANATFPSGGYDPWGMEYRQCVSYTAWKVYRETGYMYGWGNIGMGNANQWDDDARNAGVRVDSDPRGDVVVGIKNSQPYGHAVYVDHVYENGDIYISQYNALWDGRYSEARISTAGWVFIHFR